MRNLIALAAATAALALPTSASAATVIAAVGDINCAPGSSPAPSTEDCVMGHVADLIEPANAFPNYEYFLPLGDLQYEDGTLAEFNGTNGYDANFGQFNDIVKPVPGNHEYNQPNPNAEGYWAYWQQEGVTDIGSQAAPWYTWTVPGWRMIALNTNCGRIPKGIAWHGCTVLSPQGQWLTDVLTENTEPCIAAYMHHPRVDDGSSYYESSTRLNFFWKALRAFNADIVLSGHEHLYERFRKADDTVVPFDGDGDGDGFTHNGDANGLRQFIVGTGGNSLRNFVDDPDPGDVAYPLHVISQMRIGERTLAGQPEENTGDSGILRLVLHEVSAMYPDGAYSFSFRRAADGEGTVGFNDKLDAGTTPCNAG